MAEASATPTRERDKDRLPFPHSMHPSPGPPTPHRSFTSPSASAQSLSASSSNPNSLSTSHAITVQSLLKQHEGESDQNMAALEQAVNERNILAAQNTQLWKLIEKQRSGYNQILKELDRIRGERDSYKAKVLALGGSLDTKRQKPIERPTRTSSDTLNGPDASSTPRNTLSRHHSDDNAKPRLQPQHLQSSRSHEPLSRRNNDNTSHSTPVKTTSTPRSQSPPPHPPPASAPNLTYTTITTTTTPSKSQRPSPAPLVVPPRAESLATPASASTSISPDDSSILRPLQYRKNSLADSVNSISSSGTNHNVSTPTNLSSSSLNNFSIYTPTPAQPHTILTPQSAPPPIQITMSPATPQPQFQTHPQSINLSAIPEASPPPPVLPAAVDPRSSRITLPDEARQYIVNMVDSPVPSPKLDSFASSSKPKISSNLVPSQPQEQQHNNEPAGQESEFLDLDDDDEDDDEDYEDEDLEDEEDETDVGSLPEQLESTEAEQDQISFPPEAPPERQQQQQSLGNIPIFTNPFSDAAQVQQGQERGGQTRPIPEEPFHISGVTKMTPHWQQQQQHEEVKFDQPPKLGQVPSGGTNQSLINNPAAQSQPQLHSAASHSQHQNNNVQQSQTLTGSEEFLSPPLYSHPHHQQQNMAPTRLDTRQLQPDLSTTSLATTTTTTTSPTLASLESMPPRREKDHEQYRALPLVSYDLPTTSITVSHSFVRPNERGKEVLSFVILVNPGKGKECWKVEKMYSDVVALDSRVRNSVSKSILRRNLVTLPEGKLWRDHAPAKVDQRKAVLESYLQSLVKLPVKNNDEVIAFFTSDIVRETRQPVMQAGHKEGYLTKRGKNFGGWKTRYFVLQGPVLEYYESRGGAHLGSIVITGAQIGRQQRTERHTANDDEKEYRHAFLIVEAKKGPGGSHPRHVLCAESDEERDAWVEMLVRYFTGAYSEEPLNYGPSGSSTAGTQQQQQQQQQQQLHLQSQAHHPLHRGSSKDELSISKGAAIPLSQLPQDPSNAKLFSTPNNVDEFNMEPSPIERTASSQGSHQSQNLTQTQHQNPTNQNSNVTARRVLERLQGLPSSLPDSSPLSNATSGGGGGGGPFQGEIVGQRPNSEMGHYTTMETPDRKQLVTSPERHRNEGRKSFHPTSSNSNPSCPIITNGNAERSASPDKQDATSGARMKISSPLNGTPIPAGFRFGKDKEKEKEKEKEEEKEKGGNPLTGSDRRERARSRFWPGWRANGGDKPIAVAPRAVFGVPLEESLDVAQLCHLPAIVFRAIEYLEAKKADQEEGIYRLSGSSTVIKNLRDRFNAEGDVNLLASDEYWDPHAIAGLLKSYLRELPASILTRDLHFRFLAVIDFVDAQERIRELSQLIAALPLPNYSLLRALTAHLILIVQNASVNKMTMRNVGIVFSPTLGIPAGVFSLMLGEFNRVFNVDAGKDISGGDGAMVGTSSGPEGDDVLKRNSRQYSDTAADQVLGLTGRSLKASADDTPSDADDYSLQDESGTETTGDGEMTAESVSASGSVSTPIRDGDQFQQQQHSISITEPDTPVAARTSKAALAANSKGLSLTPNRGTERFSRLGAIGLPSSPRPPHSPSKPIDTIASSLDG